ncbi:Sec62/63 complex, subunit Sec66 [Coniella lustricola]|uniref:Sec62/63 complex, subunit Sec66 n=1 Tax=Coniella lustricola TaxID=2025994 RepID=A0A2T3A3C8_9PEZI|nr:Sec62/63 complex, subunit Sec66 [Coniella lustricola]
MFSLDWRGLVLPFAYILVLGGTFVTFSSVYRKRKASQRANLEPWFGPHLQRNVYLSLLHMEPEEGQEKAPKIPESILRAALIRRAVEDIHRIVQIRNAKQACSTLLAKGSVGDDLWQRFTRAETEIEAELRDVVLEANGLAPNWGQTIFQSANEIAANTAFHEKIDEIQAKTAAEAEWWEKRRAAISSDFMKELEEESEKKAPSDDGILIDTSAPGSRPTSSSGAGKKKKAKK